MLFMILSGKLSGSSLIHKLTISKTDLPELNFVRKVTSALSFDALSVKFCHPPDLHQFQQTVKVD